ncbi:restriction endonuclease subunit S [Paenibacillus kribbensis]|uniref:restriction endonuclease subunit S n=1 Tax=Paenibacillus kribbensis TaxID=172713 RepID=UPI002DB5ACE6|nr:restriction endonuclease subunit S [Paenibacillus kribbensis]MEC0235679.1 restriction endonuclease subunit S [Paenibacillus kribbensis]
MKSNYKRLGEYIKEVNNRNTNLENVKLLGVSIQKVFIPSIANTIGTDMSTYKLIKKNQFAYGPVTSRNGDKISVALLNDYEEAMISQAYTSFEVIDEDALLPEYLMMWFRRPEFDRYARFMSHGSAREIFGWEEMCNTLLPVPTITKQKKIVKEYNVLVDRIKLNKKFIQKLEETAEAIYRQWFVDFEFPDENGKPYKSNGGEMEFNKELDKEIPKGWEVERLENLIESASEKHDFKKENLIFFNTSDILDGEFLHNNYSPVDKMPGQAKKQIKRDDILYSEIRPENKRFALVRVDAEDYVVSTKLMVLRRIQNKLSSFRIYNFLTQEFFISELQQSADGRSGTFPQITFEEDIIHKLLIIGDRKIEKKWDDFLEIYYKQLFSRKDEIRMLEQMSSIILSKVATMEA